jgi:hypothetical protein
MSPDGGACLLTYSSRGSDGFAGVLAECLSAVHPDQCNGGSLVATWVDETCESAGSPIGTCVNLPTSADEYYYAGELDYLEQVQGYRGDDAIESLRAYCKGGRGTWHE